MSAEYLDDGFQEEVNNSSSSKSTKKRQSGQPPATAPATAPGNFKLTLSSLKPVPPTYNIKPTASQRAKVRIISDVVLNDDSETAVTSATPPKSTISTPSSHYSTPSSSKGTSIHPKSTVDTPSSPTSSSSKDPTIPQMLGETPKNKKGPSFDDMYYLLRGNHRLLKEQGSKIERQEQRMVRLEQLMSPPDNELDHDLPWPVPNEENLQIIESRLKVEDKYIIKSLQDIWGRGNRSDVSKFVTWNVRGLLQRTGRWTWTGKPSNAAKNAPKSGCAKDLRSVQLLKSTTLKLFAEKSEEEVIAAFMKAFRNTNDLERKRRHQEEKLAAKMAN